MVTDYAVFIDDVCFRQQVYPIQIVHFFLRIEHDRESNFYWKQPSRFIRNRDIADKRINLLRSLFISTEGQHLERQAFCFPVLVKALHRGKLLPAGSACRGPDVKHNNLTTIIGKAGLTTAQKGQGEIRRCTACLNWFSLPGLPEKICASRHGDDNSKCGHCQNSVFGSPSLLRGDSGNLFIIFYAIIHSSFPDNNFMPMYPVTHQAEAS